MIGSRTFSLPCVSFEFESFLFFLHHAVTVNENRENTNGATNQCRQVHLILLLAFYVYLVFLLTLHQNFHRKTMSQSKELKNDCVMKNEEKLFCDYDYFNDSPLQCRTRQDPLTFGK